MVTTEQTLQDFRSVYELLRHHWGTGAYHSTALGTYCVRGAFMEVGKTHEHEFAMEAEFRAVAGLGDRSSIESWNDNTLFVIAGADASRRHRHVLKVLDRVIARLRTRLIAEAAIAVEAKRAEADTVTEVQIPVTRDAHTYELLAANDGSRTSP